MPVSVLITRPEPAGARFADQLRARWGCDVPIVLSPLMRIVGLDTTPGLEGIATLIFTSRAGVDAFARLDAERDIPCYTVGEATGQAARAAGLTVIATAPNTEALEQRMIADRTPGPCLHLRGDHVAGNIAAHLTSVGIETREQVIYRQDAVPLTKEAQALLRRENPVILPLFSPRSAGLFFQEQKACAPLLVATLSAKVAGKVPKADVAMLEVARHPDGDSMLEALDALRKHANRLEGANRAQ